MATQVNKKIVIGIVAGIVLLGGALTAFALYVQASSPEKNAGRGDAAAEAGDWERAQDQYSRAVNKQPTNIEYIDKWGDALVRVIPDTDAEYQERYGNYLQGVLLLKARQRAQDGEIQSEFVEEFLRRQRLVGVNSVNAVDVILQTVGDRAAGLAEDDPYRTRILRWRGFALASKAQFVTLEDDEYQTAIDDLNAAYELDRDPTIRLDLHRLHNAVERRALAERRIELAGRAGAAAERVMSELLSDHPNDPSVIATEFLVERSEAYELNDELVAESMVAEMAEDAVSRFESIDVSRHPVDEVVQAATALGRFAPGSLVERIDAVLVRKLEEEPDSSSLKMLRANLAANSGEPERAIEIFKEIAAMPNQPVSLEGLVLLDHRREAINRQASIRIRQAEFSQGDEKRAYIEQAQALRDELNEKILAGQEPRVKKLDMQLALARNEADDALRLLGELERSNREFAQDPDILLGYVEALLMKNQPGNARERMQQLDELTGGRGSPQTLLYWGEIERNLGNFEGSLAYYERLLERVPGNEAVESRVRQLRDLVNPDNAAANPVIRAMNRSRELRAEGDLEGALAVLETGINEAPDNVRLMQMAVSLDLSLDNRERAARRVRAALEQNPDSTFLTNLLTQVEIEDPVEAQLRIVEQSDDAPVDKALSREAIYRAAGLSREADEQLATARELDESNLAVIDRVFVRAAARGEAGVPDAERAVELAMRNNADGQGGDIYRARLEIIKGAPQEAIAILTRLVEDQPYNADAWRWLGGAQRAAGLVDGAVESYEKAYKARPSDVGFAADYANALVAAGRGAEAARVLSPETGVLQFGGGGDQLVEMWLRLEGQFGDREKVARMRSVSFEREPEDVTNTLSYLQLLMRAEDWEKAREVVETYASHPQSNALRVAQMRSALLASQDDYPGAVRVMEDHIAGLSEDELTIAPFRVLAGVHEGQGEVEAAAEVYLRGRPYQGERRLLDRSLADLRFRSASQLRGQVVRMAPDNPERIEAERVWKERYTEALRVYREIMNDQGFDEVLAKRIAECQLRTGRFDSLSQTLELVVRETGNQNDLQVLLMRAVAAEEQGDRAQLMENLNRAVETNSNNPVAFKRRAQVFMTIPERLPDARADLEEAVKLAPADVEAWGMLAQTYARLGQPDQAFQKLRGAIESNPNNERLPRVLVDLYEQSGRVGEALTVATRRADAEGAESYWLDRAARLAQRAGDYDAAYRWLTIRDNDTDNSLDQYALDRLNTLLRRRSGVDIPEVNRLMRRIEAIEIEGDANIILKLLMARGEAARGNMQASDRLLVEAHDLARVEGPIGLRLFVEAVYLRELQRHPQDQAQQQMLSFIRDTPGLKPLHPYLKLEMLQPSVFAATTLEQREQINNALESVAREIDADDQVTRFRYLRLASNLRYAMRDYEGSVDATRQALQIAFSADMANNLAYTLSTHMDQHEEALPHAVSAAEASPGSSTILDTLGVIQLRVGRVEDALETLDRAVTTAVGADNLAAALLHKAEALIAADRIGEARTTINQAQTAMMRASPQVREEYGDDLQSLIDSLR